MFSVSGDSEPSPTKLKNTKEVPTCFPKVRQTCYHQNMSEKLPTTPEAKPEEIPSPESIENMFWKLVEGGAYTERRKLSDEHGVYLWEITTPSKGDEHGEYVYVRAGEHTEASSNDTHIHVLFLDDNGAPTGGHTVAEFKSGEWEILE